MMYTGCCAPLARLSLVREAGFASVELAATELTGLSDGEFAQLHDLGLPVCAVNIYCGKDLFDVNQPLEEERIRDYAALVGARTAALGAKCFGIGAPHCRSRREETPEALAMERFLRFLELTAAEAGKCGVLALLEPVNPTLCNVVNTVSEAADAITAVDSANLKLVLDFCHAKVAGETPEALLAAMPQVRHVHVGHQARQGGGRDFLGEGDLEEYTEAVALLRRGGYDGAVSMEAGGPGDYLEGLRRSVGVLERCLGGSETTGGTWQ